MRIKFMIILSLIIISCRKDKTDDVNPSTPGGLCAASKRDAERIIVFPADNPWNTNISGAKIDSRSNDIIKFLSTNNPSVFPDFGSGLYDGVPIGIPFVVVCAAEPKVKIVFKGDDYDDNYGDESDPGPYPIPLTSPIEGNGREDSHVIAVDIEQGKLYELYNAKATSDSWEASSGAIFDLNSNAQRPAGWTSADGGGLPIFAGLVRYDEVASGEINHAIRFTLSKSKLSPSYTSPARHRIFSGGNSNPNIPTPTGMRLRLKADFNIEGYPSSVKAIMTAMKKYGIILADIGSDFFISGAPDDRWNNDELKQLRNLKPDNFEVLEIGTLHQ